MDSPRSLRSRSLNLPARSRSPTRSTQDKLNTQIYAQYPILDQVMLNHLDMDGILELYALNHETFETRQSLATLTQRFNLPGPSINFKDLLAKYDKKYATVRSYNRIDKSLTYHAQLTSAKWIIKDAAVQGNIQAVINGFKLYPDLLNTSVLNEAIKAAAKGGHEEIIDLLLDLGGNPENNQILNGALNGGHIDLITGPKYRDLIKPIRDEYTRLVVYSMEYQMLPSLKYLLSLPMVSRSVPNSLIEYAGRIGNPSIIDYLIDCGADSYSELVMGAMLGEHFDLALKYLDLVPDGDEMFRAGAKDFIPKVIRAGRRDILDLLVKHDLVSHSDLAKLRE
jgi:hypothetical protein